MVALSEPMTAWAVWKKWRNTNKYIKETIIIDQIIQMELDRYFIAY